MARSDRGSLTKEPPLAKVDATIRAITPGMSYERLLQLARTDASMHRDAPGLLRQRFLLLDENDNIVYDRFLSLVAAEGVAAPRARKVMYFVWAFRDERIRRFVTECIADETGRWRAAEVTNKANASFFKEQFGFAESSGKKMRSNFEFFLTEAGIFNLTQSSIRLELDDDWLVDAMQIAAQHESIARRRHMMTQAPIDCLIANDWHGLLNATKDELRGINDTLTIEEEPLEDDIIPSSPPTATGREWDRQPPSSTGRRSTTTTIDLVSRERATASHHKLESIMAELARAQGYTPETNENIDMYFTTPAGTVLAEMKSCHSRNLRSQIRRGVSQLFEYRFVYRKLLGNQVAMVLVVESPPSVRKRWLVQYLESVGITLAWKETGTDRFVTTVAVGPALAGIVSRSR